MAPTYDVSEAGPQLPALVDRAAAGEEIVIARDGRPAARLVGCAGAGAGAGAAGVSRARRAPGGWRGRVHMAGDFDELPAGLAAAFQGEDDGE